MLTFSFDASGDEKTPMLTVAGFASSEKDWQAFSELWTKRLADDGIDFFHAVDLACFRGPFKHWQDRPDREKLRRMLSADLMDILKEHVYHRFGCTIINKDFQQMSEELREQFALCAYSVAGRTCEKYARKWVAERWTWKGKQTSVEMVFEAGDKGKGKLQKQLADDNVLFPIFKPKKDTLLEDGTIQAGFVPLQAADWLAYELNLATQKYYDGKLESETDLPWPMQEFLSYPPGYMGIYTSENLKEMESGLELQKKIVEWEIAAGLGKKSAARGTP
jgi:hypothetical protein